MSPERPVERVSCPVLDAAAPPNAPVAPSAPASSPEGALERARTLIQQAGQALHEAEQDLQRARERRDQALRAGYELGMSKKDLADVSGLTQPAVAKRLEVVGIKVITHAERAARRAERDAARRSSRPSTPDRHP